MIVYRLAKGRFKTDISGTGARLYGGRWNNRGTQMLYTGASTALCALEIAVRSPLHILPKDYHIISIFIPDDLAIFQLSKKKMPQDWDSMLHGNQTQKMGDYFIDENEYLIMKVPSAVIKGDYNYLINPFHPDFEKVKIVEVEPFEFDSRLFN